jgi:nitrogen fixation NifU-like protein
MGANPMCGDKLKLFVQIDDQRIADIRFEGDGCAIFKASCSLLSEIVQGKTVAEAEHIIDTYLHHITQDETQADDNHTLGKLAVFAGVRKYPVRVKCAALVARTLQSVLHDSDTNAVISSDGHL